MLDPGTYRAVAIEAALGETDGGKPQVAVLFSLLDLPGTKRTWYGYFTEKTEERTIQSLRTAGWTGNDLSDLSDLSRPDTPEVNLVIDHEEDLNGNMRERVKWINGNGGVALKKQLEPDKAKAFAATMRAKVVAFDAKNGGAPKPAPKPAAKPVQQPASGAPAVGF